MPEEWTKAKILKFLKLFSSEPILWDLSHRHNNMQKNVIEAWERISMKLDNTEIAELKRRKKNLITRYRSLAKKKKTDSEACCDEEIYQPSWYAFELMDSFLGYSSHEDPLEIESERQKNTKMETNLGDDNPKKEVEVVENILLEFKRRNDNSDNESIQTNETIRSHNVAMSNCSSNHNISKNAYEDDDECELYGRLLANKLKRYPVERRHRLMYTIDGLLLDNPYSKERVKK